MSREWLEWTMHTQDIHLQHKFNGREHTLGRRHVPVDGWDPINQTAYQFHGCLWHGHSCYKTRGKTLNEVNGKPLDELQANTAQITQYLRDEVGVKVVEMWECEWEKEKQHHPTIHSFLETHLSVLRPSQGCQEISEKDILTAVKNWSFFGLVQCDVEVPAHLREYFSEMPPIFKNCAVSREDIGDFMKDYAKEHKLLSQPRQTLISSFSAQGILLTTPLLQWYLSHGLMVTNIQQTVEYKPQKCFQNFGEKVSNARRQGDTDPSKAVLFDTFKLFGE